MREAALAFPKRLQMDRLLAEARGFGLHPAEVDAGRPWGGFIRFTHDSLSPFIDAYWAGVDLEIPSDEGSVDPKVLIVAPGAMLSLQWHERRSEIWRVLDGPVRVIAGSGWSDLRDSVFGEDAVYRAGDVIRIAERRWHRLSGLAGWCRVAEIWKHTDVLHPSDEEDIVREHDIYDRADPKSERKWKDLLRPLAGSSEM